MFRSAATTTGLRLGLTTPTFTTFSAGVQMPIVADGAAASWFGTIISSGDSVVSPSVEAINTDYIAVVEGLIVPSANGTLQLQHATEVNASGVTIRQPSCGFLTTL